MENLTNPAVLASPFCAMGDKNTIPLNATGTQNASLAEGFPPVTQKSIDEGGIPPERKDFNGIANLNSQFYFAFQNGWLPTFNDDVSTAIGGYPLGSVLWYVSQAGTVSPVRSLIANNTYNFNTNPAYIGVYWAEVGIDSRANVDLSNLSQTGEAHFANPSLSNVSGTSGLRKLKEVYVNGASWYKVFEEYNQTTGELIGEWCEQGGYTTENTTVTFLKPFINAGYGLSGMKGTETSGAAVAYESQTATSVIFRIGADLTGDKPLYWQAWGYIS